MPIDNRSFKGLLPIPFSFFLTVFSTRPREKNEVIANIGYLNTKDCAMTAEAGAPDAPITAPLARTEGWSLLTRSAPGLLNMACERPYQSYFNQIKVLSDFCQSY